MDIFLKRTIQGFIPLYDSDYEAAKKIPLGKEVKASIKTPRNYQFHKKFFALLNLGFNNQGHYDNFETFRFVMTMKAGFFDSIETHKGHQVFKPKSISFGSMTEEEFVDLYSNMLDVIIEVTGSDKELIENELINFM